mgnify:FL=1
MRCDILAEALKEGDISNYSFMKRLLFTLLAGTTLVGARAQYTAFPKFSDNWSVTVAGGVVHPLIYEPQPKLLTPTLTVGMKKQLTSAFSLGVDVDYVSWNNKLSLTRYERSQVHLVGSLNLGNLFAGSVGHPRLFEVEVKGSAGWGHIFNKSRRNSFDANYLVSKWGIDFTCNFGAHRRWGIGVRPGVRFDLRNDGAVNYESFNANRAEFDLSLGVTYRLGAKRTLALCQLVPAPIAPVALVNEPVVSAQVANTPAVVNAPVETPTPAVSTSTTVSTTPVVPVETQPVLEVVTATPTTLDGLALGVPMTDDKKVMQFFLKEMANRDVLLATQKQRIAQLELLLAKIVANPQTMPLIAPIAETTPATTATGVTTSPAVTSAPATAQTTAKVVHKLETIISFGVGRVVVDAPQFPNVERVAAYLKSHPRARVEVRGYSSPEGPLATNIRIAKQRAEAVKNLLIAQYGISKNRIDADGGGVGHLFRESEWNSVAICTVFED